MMDNPEMGVVVGVGEAAMTIMESKKRSN